MASPNAIVLDLETQKSLSEVGKSQLHKLKISVVGVYDYVTDQFLIYEEKDILALESRLKDSRLIIGFNIRRFDMVVLEPYLTTPAENFPILDLMEDIEQVRGHRASLESLAIPTLHQRKSGTGRDALILFKENRMEELKRYCLEDVRITKEIYEYGCREGKVLFTSSRDYKTYEIPVTWKRTSDELLERSQEKLPHFPTSLF